MTTTTTELVAEIRTLYGRRHEEKLQIQRDMVALRDAPHNWSTWDIAEKTEVPHTTVVRWLQAYDESLAQVGQPSRLTPQSEQTASDQSVARRVAIERPDDLVTELTPAQQRRLASELDTAAAIRQKEREAVSKAKEREHLGDELVEDLALKEELQSTEYLLIKARGNIRGFVEHTREFASDLPPAWRESCLEWIDDLEGHLGMAKALLAGDDIDWASFEELLAKEGS